MNSLGTSAELSSYTHTFAEAHKSCARLVVGKSFRIEINSNRQIEPARMPLVLCKSTSLGIEEPELEIPTALERACAVHL